MKPEVLLELLESTAGQLKVRVSYEPLQTSVVHGGLCRVKGEYRIIVDKRASAEERMTTVAAALAQVIKATKLDIAALEMPPKVREILRMHEPAPAPAAGGRTAA
ncbi:MAG TPA: hypothetical protein VFK02_06545 [Kofleriaceae bacterium]|nr:hypothetical protein [Kofleriaceae bacterium]